MHNDTDNDYTFLQHLKKYQRLMKMMIMISTVIIRDHKNINTIEGELDFSEITLETVARYPTPVQFQLISASS